MSTHLRKLQDKKHKCIVLMIKSPSKYCFERKLRDSESNQVVSDNYIRRKYRQVMNTHKIGLVHF